MVTLGDKVRDLVSGFEGIAVSSHTYLNGCTRISIQPPVDKEGKLPEVQSFDEPQLIVAKAGAITFSPIKESRRTGGPDKYPDTERR